MVSATSPPWVVGVENLFTPEFYALARQALTDDGVFFQWFPLYSMDASSLHTILANLRSVFPHLRLYRISYVEMGILASARPLSELAERRFYEPGLEQIRATMQLNDPDLLLLVELFETKGLEAIVANGESRMHTLARPALAYASDRVRFVNAPVDWNTFVDERVARLLRYSDERRDAFGRMLGRYPSGLHCTEPTPGPQLFCERYNRLLQAYAILSQGSSVIAEAQAFDILRQEGLQPLDPGFLAHQASRLVDSNPDDLQALQAAVDRIVLVYAKDGLWDEALRDLKILADAGLITAQYDLPI